MTLYEAVGGRATFELIAKVFYEGIAADEVLLPMYAGPDAKPGDLTAADLAPAAERLQLFLEQYWGGPTDYQELRGHPRLRMRHMPYAINRDARDRWLKHMRAAVDAAVAAGLVAPLYEAELWDYLERAATSLMNTNG
jgi:hemoglobin